VRYFLCLGSNMGRKRENLARARSLLEAHGVRVLRRSSLYRTQPVAFERQPWFINQVLGVESGKEPGDLLRLVKRLEKEMKRIPGRRFGPRRIDIDILLAGRKVISEKALRIPHPRLAGRRFVLTALAEVAPRAVHPLLKKSARRLLSETSDRAVVMRIEGG